MEIYIQLRPCSRWGPAHHPPPRISLLLPQMRPSMLRRKGILNDSLNVHVMSKLSQFPIPNSSYTKYIPTYRQTQVKLLKVDWGDDNQITRINLRKSLARDYALNKLYATSGQQSGPSKLSDINVCIHSSPVPTFTLCLVITNCSIVLM